MFFIYVLNLTPVISNHPKVFCKKGAVKNFAKFRGKQQSRSLFFNKIESLRLATLSKKETAIKVFFL